jgi:tetratricopeptide (TPR) repeat protein
VLQTIGAREPGTARLEEALAAHRQALLERTRERVPLDWAATQNNLGGALKALGERARDAARLEEAIQSFTGALEVYRSARTGLDLGGIESNLKHTEAALQALRSKG